MILGESHYSDHPRHRVGETWPEMTQDVVRSYLDGSLGPRHRPTLTKMISIAARKPSHSMLAAERAEVWHSVIFYNYVPVVVASGPGQPIREEFWRGDAISGFRDVIRKARVEAILVCGLRLWDGMWRAMPEVRAVSGVRWYGTGQPQRAAALPMHHPASPRGWKFERWSEVMDRLHIEVAHERERVRDSLAEAANEIGAAAPGR